MSKERKARRTISLCSYSILYLMTYEIGLICVRLINLIEGVKKSRRTIYLCSYSKLLLLMRLAICVDGDCSMLHNFKLSFHKMYARLSRSIAKIR
jgi:hypothetical protein